MEIHNPRKLSFKDNFTKVTTLSKFLALSMLIVLPVVGFYMGFKYGKITTTSKLTSEFSTKLNDTEDVEYYVTKTPVGSDKLSYRYQLVSNTPAGGKEVLYSITNWNGFGYDVSDDKKFIAIINYGRSMGDEELVLIDYKGDVLKEFGHLDSPQALIPIYWNEHYYWLSMGVPVGEPVGTLRINADTFEVDRYEKVVK